MSRTSADLCLRDHEPRTVPEPELINESRSPSKAFVGMRSRTSNPAGLSLRAVTVVTGSAPMGLRGHVSKCCPGTGNTLGTRAESCGELLSSMETVWRERRRCLAMKSERGVARESVLSAVKGSSRGTHVHSTAGIARGAIRREGADQPAPPGESDSERNEWSLSPLLDWIDWAVPHSSDHLYSLLNHLVVVVVRSSSFVVVVVVVSLSNLT